MKKAVIWVMLISLALCLWGCQAPNPPSDTTSTAPVLDPNLIAVTIGDHKLPTAELSYYYIDAVSEYYISLYNSYGNYAQYFLGFTPGVSLNQQIYDKETNTTWAGYFINAGIENAHRIYTLYDEAVAKGHKLTEAEQENLDAAVASLDKTAAAYGYSSGEAYLHALYGSGATRESYKEYFRINTLASSYYAAYTDSLTYTDADYRAYEKDRYHHYSSFTYAVYSINVSSYLTGGTLGEDGKTTVYSAEEKAAALAAAKADADQLANGKFEDIPAFTQAVEALDINKDNTDVVITKNANLLYSRITDKDLQKWISDEGRNTGDTTAIAISQQEETVAFNVVYLQDINENITNLVDVQHILIKFEGGKTDSMGNTTFTDAEKKAARDKAETLLADWKAGEATKESFAELAMKESKDPGSASNGGLYEDIFPGRMVPTFNDWCFDEARKPGDTGIVETVHGYHIMYFAQTKDVTYRDSMLKQELMARDLEGWLSELTKKLAVTKGDLSQMQWEYTFG